MANIAAAIITIGDELLIGQTIDTNSAWIARRLNEQGIEVIHRVAVGDNREHILTALDEELERVDLLLITGGLGPTADDITKPLLKEYFGAEMIVDERVLAHLKNIFAKRNRPILERNMKQAEVPNTCTVLFNRMGTAPGMWFEKNGKVIISLPGVPFEMVSIMEHEVLPRLRERFSSDAFLHVSIVTAGEGESIIAERILDLEEALPNHMKLAYLPGAGMVKLRLTCRGADSIALLQELEHHQGLISSRLQDIVVALEDIPLEEILGRWFVSNKATLGLAESCTGGYMAHHLTQVSGSSAYFKGAIVCYNEDVKHRLLGVQKETIANHNVVSGEVAKEMAEGALASLDVDYAFAVTGMLSPCPEYSTVESGTIWMAVAGKGKTVVKRYKLHYDRQRNKEMAVSLGMLALWKFIHGREI